MHGPSVVLSDDDDSVLDISPSRAPGFQIPGRYVAPPVGASGPMLGTDILINKRKVSSDILSSSSGRSGSSQQARSEEDGSEYTGSEYDDDGAPLRDGAYGSDALGNRMAAEKSRLEAEMNEKREILYQMDRLESKGYNLPRKFTMQSDVEEMRGEYHRVLREKEVDASIRFQRKMIMAFVTGVEYFNTRFDPFDMKLDGWSEQVHENLTDYDDIFEELHDKYKSTGQKMAPELRLLMSMSGSAFMFHLTNSMFKQQPLPGVEAVLRSNPELMRHFQSAAVATAMQQRTGMAPPQQQQQQQQQQKQQSSYETMSVSDEEITSIIEDTADLAGIVGGKIRRSGGPPKNKRTLSL
jgi:hypothetical protein